jgi:DNA polymerase-3 subunit beta
MKLTITKEKFLQGLQAVQNVVGTRTTLPVLANVLMRASENRLDLTATDLDVTISCGVEAQVAEGGVTTLPARRLFSIVRELGPGEISMEVDEKDNCALAAGACFFKVRGLSGEDFPPLAALGEQPVLVLSQEGLRGMLRRTAFAASTDEARYVLNGLFCSCHEHNVTMAATDGRRLALTDQELEASAPMEAAFIVPTKAINELLRLLGDKGEARITPMQNQVAVTMVGETGFPTMVISKLVDGTYPNYQHVIPPESKEHVTLPREELLQAVRRAEIMTSERSNSVKLRFERHKLTISANTPEVGEASETLAINYKGAELTIAFNPGFLMDGLKAVDNDEVLLELTDGLSPCVLKGKGRFLYVIMPLRTA